MIARLHRWTINALATFGVLSLACVVYIHIVMWYETHVEPPRCAAIPSVSPVAKDLAAKITPGLIEAAKDYEPDFLNEASNPLSRWAGAKIYPVIVTKIPTGVEVGCDRLLSRFGKLSLEDMIGQVVRHAQAKGETLSPSLQRFQRADAIFFP